MPPAENSSSTQLLDFRGPEKKLHGPLLGGQALGNWTHSNWRQRKAGNFVMQSSLLHWRTHRLTCPTARPSLLPLADQGPDAALLAEMPSRTSPARCCCTPSCLLHTRHTSRPSPHSDSANPSCPYYGTAAVLITALLLLRTRSALEAFSSCPHRPWTFHGPFAPAATRKPKFVPPHDTRLCQSRVSHHGRHECNLEGGPVVAHVYSRWDHPQSFASSPSSSRYRHSLPYPADNRSNRFCLIGKPESIHLHCY